MSKPDILWAPWRIGYIRSQKTGPCFLCAASRSRKDREHLVLHRGQGCFVMLNAYPYNNGHLMVVPYRHTRRLDRLAEEGPELFSLQAECVEILTRTLHPHGFNTGLNLGRCAGAGVVGHLHYHIVPRWEGDSNFITTVGGSKVISQSLGELYRVLAHEFKPLKSGSW